ncbi:MAG: winged helix DNA-binding protein [Rhodoferax sp.]
MHRAFAPKLAAEPALNAIYESLEIPLIGVLSRMERDGLIRRERDPEDQRRTVVEATAKGLRLVSKLSQTVEAHYAWMEKSLGKQKLAQLYALLDTVIELEQP